MEQFAPVKRSKDGQPVRYLIVDDSVFARKNLARMIESFGGQVGAEAGDGLTAISEFERTHPDIVLMDITMPEPASSWCLPSAIRKTLWLHCSAGRGISCRSR